MVLFPPCKINLGLYVTERRSDGYHNIDTLFYPLRFTDILEILPDPAGEPGTISLGLSGLNVEGASDTNLVVKAYRRVHEKFGMPAVKAYLHKCIPTGAGLGGGSSDGAAMLRALNELMALNLSQQELFAIALELGSDCPFFLNPEPSFAAGRGEELKLAGFTLKGFHLQLYHPGAGISTALAYRNVKVEKPRLPLEQAVSMPLPEWKDNVQNVFEPFAFKRMPLVSRIKEELYRSGAVYASMTGSGSAVYGIFTEKIVVPPSISAHLIWEEDL